MQCINCSTENDQSSKYCKECGHRFKSVLVSAHSTNPSEAIQIGELIYAAYKHKDAGRMDEAISSCEGAILLNPGNSSAHALLSSLFELNGDLTSAVNEFEKVVELTPDSDIDLKKLAELRQMQVSAKSKTLSFSALYVKYRSYLPHIAAVVSFGVVLVAILFVLRGNPTQSTNGTPSNSNVTPFSSEPVQPSSMSAQMQIQQQGAASRENVTAQQVPQAASTASHTNLPEQGVQGAPPILSQFNTVTAKPAQSQPSVPKPQASALPVNQSPAIMPVVEPTHQPTPKPAITPVETPAITPVMNPSAANSALNRVYVNPEEKAIQYQTQGKYQNAISSYRDALLQTKDKGRILQQIGMCYQRLGERDLAVDSYNKAIRAFHSQASAGRDPSEVDRNIKACENAIKVNK